MKLFDKQKHVQHLWNRYKEDFLKILAHEQSKSVEHSQLEQIFVDRKGQIYYRFPQSIDLPIERLGKVNEYISWMSAGMSGEEQEKFLSAVDDALMDGLNNKDKKAPARIGSIIQQMRERRRMVIHTELLYNFLAVQWIRADEQPDVFSNQIQMEKVEQFKEEVAHSNSYFFFQQAELKRLSVLLNFTETEWEQYWQESLIKQQALSKTLEVYSQTYAKK